MILFRLFLLSKFLDYILACNKFLLSNCFYPFKPCLRLKLFSSSIGISFWKYIQWFLLCAWNCRWHLKLNTWFICWLISSIETIWCLILHLWGKIIYASRNIISFVACLWSGLSSYYSAKILGFEIIGHKIIFIFKHFSILII